MSYDHESLYRRILLHMMREPCISVQNISKELQVSRRTIQSTIQRGAKKSYSALRREILVAKTIEFFSVRACAAIKEVSFAVGFASPRSFARAIRKATGMSPEDLRSRVLADELALTVKTLTFCENEGAVEIS
jgi:AraC-like DNA-binding protein